jgi:hypothetical protein
MAMKGPGLFSDIGKKAKDLLTKDYTYDQKFTISTVSASGVVRVPPIRSRSCDSMLTGSCLLVRAHDARSGYGCGCVERRDIVVRYAR